MFCDKAREYVTRGKAATWLLCDNIAKGMETYAKEHAAWKDRTAHARQSINGRATQAGDTCQMTISHGVRYGKYLEKGTPPHIITPKSRKALYWNGASHPVRLVHHPGTKGYPTILPAAEHGKEELKKAVLALWEGGA
ncbi:MAG: hypothetical protein PUE51_05895 [Veillonellaceae bacterium]|nr:hypothetical protein [Veillonellaceae bacterium]